jgi:hypothetical protein
LTVLQSLLFPLGLQHRNDDLSEALKELEKSRLAILYQVASKPYVQVSKWQRCGSAMTSRFPWKDGSFDIKYIQLATRDGPKDFVSSSVDLPTGSSPPTDGVASELNTKTKTNYEYGDVLRRRITKTNSTIALSVNELESLCIDVLGTEEWSRFQSRWRKRIQFHPDQLAKVLAEVKTMKAENKIKTTPAKTAEDLIKRGFGK